MDTCAGEFPSSTPYLYSSYDEENEARAGGDRTVVILGSGPNRIGQGVEFDYCCVRAALAFRELGYRTVMVNSNPETVSTDFDISDTLYFEPLTLEDVLEIVHVEQPIGVVVQLGGQTPLQLARGLERAGVRDSRHLARRDRPGRGPRPVRGDRPRARRDPAAQRDGALGGGGGGGRRAGRVSRCWCARPTCSAGGRMQIVYDDAVAPRATSRRAARVAPEHPVLIDSFLEDAFEADVDAIADGTRCVIGGVMQHIEDAGIHSGDSACVLPPYLITEAQVEEMRRHTRAFAERLGVVGLINVQYAIKNGVVYVLEVNPRGSRTVPFVSKTTGVPLASLAAAVMVGADARRARAARRHRAALRRGQGGGVPLQQAAGRRPDPRPRDALDRRGHGHRRLVRDGVRQGADRGRRRAAAEGAIFVTVNDHDKAQRGADRAAVPRDWASGSSPPRARRGISGRAASRPRRVLKVHEGRPNAIDLLVSGQVQLLINTPLGKLTQQDDYTIRRAALQHRVPYTTTLSAASAACDAIIALRSRVGEVRSLQEWHALAREMSPNGPA